MSPRCSSARRAMAVLGLGLAVATCRDAVGPPSRAGAGLGQLGFAPILPSDAALASFGLAIDSVRIVVIRPAADTLADTTVALPPDSTALDLDLQVSLVASPETLTVAIVALAGTTPLFTGSSAVEVTSGPGTPTPTPIPVTTYVGPGAGVDSIAIAPAAPFLYLNDSLRFQVAAFQGGVPVTQVYVAWSTSDSTVADINNFGVLRAPAVRGAVRVRARTPGGIADSVTATFVPLPTQLVKIAGDAQAGAAGQALALPLEVEVRAADNLPVGGVGVRFRSLSGGTPADTTVPSDGNGRAQVVGVLGALTGTQTFQATVPAFPAVAAQTFTATATSPAPTRLAFTAQPPASTVAGAALAPAIEVTVLDGGGDPATTATNSVTLALGANPGGDTASAVTVSAVNGVATFSGLVLTKAAAAYTLIATAAGLTPDTSSGFAITPAGPAALVFSVQPSAVIVGSAIAPAVQVAARDSFGNATPSFAGDVTVEFSANPGSGSLSGTLTQTAASGSATFGDLRIDQPGAGYTLRAVAAGMTADTSAAFDVAAAAGTVMWVNGAGGNWSTAANWSGGVVPGPTDVAVISLGGTYTVTLDVNDTIAGVLLGGTSGTQTLSLATRTLGIDTALVGSNGELRLTSSTLNGAAATLVNQGTVVVRGSTVLNVALATSPGSLIRVEGDPFCCTATVTVANGFTNTGTIDLTAVNGTGTSAQLTVTAGTLVNAAGGAITSSVGTGGTRTLAAQLDNQGTVTIMQPLTLAKASAAHTNSGTIALAGGDLTLAQSGASPSFTTSATITVGAGDTLAVTSGTFDYAGGAIGGLGTVTFSSATLALTSGLLTNDTLALSFVNSTVNGPGTLTNAAGRTLSLQSVTVNAPLANQGTLRARATTSLNGAVTTGPASTLRVEGDPFCCTATVTVASGFTNTGTIELTAINAGGTSAQLTVTAGTLVNASGATIASLPGTGGARTLAAELDNQGTVTVSQALTIAKAAAQHTNSGTIALGANLVLSQSGTSPTFTTTGTVTVGAGDTLAVGGGTFAYAGGALGGLGTVTFSSSTLALTPGLANDTLTLSFLNSTVNGPGTLTNAAGRTLVLQNVTVNAALANQGLLRARSTTNVNGPLTTAPGSTLRAEGDPFCCTATVTVANGFTNTGTIELTAINAGGTTAQLGVTAGTLVNGPGATIASLPGTGGARTLAAELDNQGTLTVAQPMTLSRSSAAHQNSGTIALAGANLTLLQNGTAPAFTTTGTITIAAGDTLAVSGGAFDYAGGTLGGLGAATFSGTTLTLTATLLVNDTLALSFLNSAVNGPGTLTNAAARTLVLQNVVVNAPFVNQGLTVARSTTALNGTVTAAAGSTLRVEGDPFCCSAFLTVASGFTNSGTIDLTAVNGLGTTAQLAVTAGTLVNAPGGVITSSPGTGGARGLDAEVDNQGTITIVQPLTWTKTAAAHANSGTIVLAGGDLALAQTGGGATFSNTGTLTVGGGDTLAVSGGTFDYAAGAIGGPGTVTFSSTTVLLTPDLVNDTLALSFLNSTVNGPGTLANATGRTLVLQNTAVNAPFLSQGLTRARSNTNLNGTLTTAPGSTLRVEGDPFCCTASVTVASGFTNAGTIDLTAVNGAGTTAQLTVTTGVLVNGPGGVITSSVGTGGARTLAAVLDNQGAVTIAQPLTLTRTSAAHTNTGTITVAGTLTVSGLGSSLANATGGIIDGTGTLDVTGTSFTNAGNVNPGTSPGVLTVTGNYGQASVGALNVELAGTTVGTQYDQLAVSGAAALAGALNVTLTGGFVPVLGDTFTVLTFASRTGSFPILTGLDLGGGLSLDTVYDATRLRLAVSQPRLAFTVQPSGVVAGAAISPAVEVTARDGAGNPITSYNANVTVAIGTNPGGGTLAGTTTAAAVNGVATFADLSINFAGTGYTLTATGAGAAGATSGAFNVIAGPATHLVFFQQPPPSLFFNDTFTVRVAALDAFGNLDSGFAQNVFLSENGGSTNPVSVLSGTLTQAADKGIATFADLFVTGTDTTAIDALADAMTGATSDQMLVVNQLLLTGGDGIGQRPFFAGVDTATNRVYVSNTVSRDLSVIDAALNKGVTTIPMGSQPGWEGVNPVTQRVFVSDSIDGDVKVIDEPGERIEAAVGLGPSAAQPAVDVEGKFVFVPATPDLLELFVLDDAYNIIDQIPIGEAGDVAAGAAWDADPARRWVWVVIPNRGMVKAVDPFGRQAVDSFIAGELPYGIVVDTVRDRLYVTVGGGQNAVVVYDMVGKGIITTIPVGITPQGLSMDPKTNRLFVANYGEHTVSVIDLVDFFEIARIPMLGRGPGDAEFNARNGLVYVPNGDDGTLSIVKP